MENDYSSRVTATVPASVVQPGFWRTDPSSQYAVLMDDDQGHTVWYRSRDWAMFGLMHGFDRVARVSGVCLVKIGA